MLNLDPNQQSSFPESLKNLLTNPRKPHHLPIQHHPTTSRLISHLSVSVLSLIYLSLLLAHALTPSKCTCTECGYILRYPSFHKTCCPTRQPYGGHRRWKRKPPRGPCAIGHAGCCCCCAQYSYNIHEPPPASIIDLAVSRG